MHTLIALAVLTAGTFGAAFLAAAPLTVTIPVALVTAGGLVMLERRLARRTR